MRVAIIGGGTSGWMTASYLSRAFGRSIDLTVIESKSIGTIGVGEATFSTFKLFFDFLGLSERDWMPSCSASFKLAIRFQNWTKAGGHFYHPFERFRSASSVGAADWWLKLRQDGGRFDDACFVVPKLCDARRAPRYLDGRIFDRSVSKYFDNDAGTSNTALSEQEVQYPYGYHFNASELSAFLRDYAVRQGVTQVVDNVVGVELHDDGSIERVRTESRGDFPADLFIDCSGFRGLLINQALGEPFIGFGDTLMNDAAVAIQAARSGMAEELQPYTTAHALTNGWAWDIPLYTRDGTGYVYSSRHISAEAAERELRQHLGSRSDGCPANHIKMRVGRTRNSWVKNCVAVGLSSGFVEPLESTGIFFIQNNIEELVRHFPRDGKSDPAMVRSFNLNVGRCIDGVRDFLSLHYQASDRDDTPYWRDTRKIVVSADMQERLDIWSARLPDEKNVYPYYHGFGAHSWSIMLLGLGGGPASSLPRLDGASTEAAVAMFDRIRTEGEELVATLPSAYEYLTRLRQPVRQEAAE